MVSPALDIILRGTDYLARWGVVEHWALNEASGAARASISSANDLTANNAPTSAAGKVYPLARQLTAPGSMYFSLPDNAAMSGGDIDMAIPLWVYLDSKAASRLIVAKWGDGANNEYLVRYNVAIDRFQFQVSPDGLDPSFVAVSANTFGSPSTATWYLLVPYHDAVNNVIGLSVNNGPFDTAAFSAGIFNGTESFLIGAKKSAVPNGFMDGRTGPVTLCKSPPLGIAALAIEIRDRMYNGGNGRLYPWR